MVKKCTLVMLSMILIFTIIGLSSYSAGAEITTLTVWSTWPDKGVKTLITKYEAAHPNVKIDYLFIPWNNTVWAQKITTAKLADSLPDLVMSAQGGSEWSEPVRGIYMSLNEYIERDNLDIDDFVKALVNPNTLNGQIYGVPLWFDFGMLFYNKKMLAEAGYDGSPRTWDDLVEYTTRLTMIKDKKLIRMGFAVLEFPNFFTLQAVAGGHMFSRDGLKATFNSPEMLKAADLMIKLRDIMGGMDELTRIASTEVLGAEADSFVRYKSAMMYMNAISEIGRIKKFAPDMGYGIGLMPSPKGIPQSLIHTSGASLQIPAPAKHREEAWDFLKFWTSRENLLSFVQENLGIWAVLPGRISCVKDPRFLSTDPNLPEIAKKIDSLQPIGHKVHPLATDAHWINMIKAVEDFLWGKATPEEALNEATQKAQEFLDKTFKDLRERGVEIKLDLY